MRLGDQSMHLAEQVLDAAAVFGQGAVQSGEALFLSLAEAVELGEGQAARQPFVILDGTAEEVAQGDNQKRWPDGGRQQLGEEGVAGAAEVGGNAVGEAAFGLEEALRLRKAGERSQLTRQAAGIERGRRQQPGLTGVAQFLKAGAAEVVALGGKLIGRNGVEERPNLVAQAAVACTRQARFATFPEGVAGKGDFQRFPGAFVGFAQDALEVLTVVAEAAGEHLGDAAAERFARFAAEHTAGALHQGAQAEGGYTRRG